MPITINDAGDYRVGRIASTMDAFTAAVAGTYTAPGDRVGVVRANVAEYTTSLLGQASVPESRDGLLDSTLDNFTTILNGQLTAGATFDVWVRDDGSDGGAGTVGSPLATFAEAFTRILPGIPGVLNTIWVDAAGSSATFTEEVVFTKNYIQIKRVAGKTITWAGISTGNRADPCFQFDNAIGCVVDGIDIDGGAPSTGSTVASCATFRDSVDCGFINASCDDVYGGTGVQNNDIGFLMGDFNTGSTRCYLRNLDLTNCGAHEVLIGAGQDRGDGILIPNECVSTELDDLRMTRWGAHDCIVDWADRTWAHDITINNDWTPLTGGTDRYGRAFSLQDQQEPGAPLSTGARGSLYEDIIAYNIGGSTDASRTLSCKVGGANVVFRNFVLRNNPNDFAIGFAHEGNRGGHYEDINIYNGVVINHGRGMFELFENTNGTGNGLPDYSIGESNRFNCIGQDLLNDSGWVPGSDERNATATTTRYIGSSDGSILSSPFVFKYNIVEADAAYVDNEGENNTNSRMTLATAESTLSANFNNNTVKTVTFVNELGTTVDDFATSEVGGMPHATVGPGDAGTGTSLIVQLGEAYRFRDDMGITGKTGDQIYVNDTLVTVVDVVDNFTLTISQSVPRSPGDEVVWAGAYTAGAIRVGSVAQSVAWESGFDGSQVAVPWGSTYDLSANAIGWQGGVSFVTIQNLPTGITQANEILTHDGITTINQPGVQMTVEDQPVSSDWESEKLDANTIWFHDFQNDDEVYFFNRVSSTESNPDPASKPLAISRVTTPYTGSFAIASKGAGCVLATGVASVTPNSETPQTWQMVSIDDTEGQANYMPDPAIFGAYLCLVGDRNDVEGNDGNLEYVTINSINYSANTINLLRSMESTSNPGNGYAHQPGTSLGLVSAGQWARPFAAIDGATNGKGVDDPGFANGLVQKLRSFDTTPGASGGRGHYNWREGYIGHKWYWDTGTNPSAPYATTWTPDLAPTTPINLPYDSDVVYVRWLMKISGSRDDGRITKLWKFENAPGSGPGQLFVNYQSQRYGEILPAALQQPGISYGGLINAITNFGDGSAKAGGVLGAGGAATQPPQSTFTDLSNLDAIGGRFHEDFPQSQKNHPSGFECAVFPLDQWFAFMFEWRPGRDNSESGVYNPSYEGGQGGGRWEDPFPSPQPSGTWLSDTDPTYKSTYKQWIAYKGDTAWRELASSENFSWMYGDGKFDWGQYEHSPPGTGCVYLVEDQNYYLGGGSVLSPKQYHEIQYARPICGRAQFAVPEIL